MSTQSSNLSSVSLNTRLPIINDALVLLDNSPIPKKKFKSNNWINQKVSRVSENLKRSLGVSDEDREAFDGINKDEIHFRNLINRLKENFYYKETDRAHQLQILTLLPTTWSPEKISETMNTTVYMARKSKKLLEEKGISLPNTRQGESSPKYHVFVSSIF